MNTFFTVLKNNYLRTIPRIVPVMIYTGVTLLTILFSIYFTGTQQVRARIIYIPADSSVSIPHSSSALQVTASDTAPSSADLMKRKYDAAIFAGSDGSYQIRTYLNEKSKNMILNLVKHPDADLSSYEKQRGVGVNVLGFMMMFLLMSALSNLFAFSDDREQGQLSRIILAPISFSWYMAAHMVYCITLLLPAYLLLVLLKLLGWNIGFSLLQFAGLILLLALLGISMALLLHTLIIKPDNANMLGNSITVLTCLLAGSFHSITSRYPVLNKATDLLPQKKLLDYAGYLEQNTAAAHSSLLYYVILFSLFLFLISVILLRKQYLDKK
jgi:ABC-2 type transport system permease protein